MKRHGTTRQRNDTKRQRNDTKRHDASKRTAFLRQARALPDITVAERQLHQVEARKCLADRTQRTCAETVVGEAKDAKVASCGSL